MSADLPPVTFVDTNVIIYALVGDDPVRSPKAQERMRTLLYSGQLRTSTQVLQEAYVIATRKGRPSLPHSQVLSYLDRLAEWPVVASDYLLVREAATLSSSDRLSFWDALIVVAASRAGAARLYTEDLTAGQRILGVEIVNPFAAPRAPAH